MPAHPGERAQETGTFHCRDCDASVRVSKGGKIPRCPCGGTYVARSHERGSRPRTPARKKTNASRARAASGAGKSRRG
jgi:Ser-tRNA(Ala) deacylase AlaX